MKRTFYGTAGSSTAPLMRAAGVVGQSVERGARFDNQAVLTLGRQTFSLVYLEAGATVSTITWVSASTAAVSPTNQWFSLYSAGRAKLAVTVDDTTTAWAANTVKTLALAAPYVVPTAGNYYLGCMVAGGQVPTLTGVPQAVGGTVIYGFPPIRCGRDDTNTGLTTPATAPATAAALVALPSIAYVQAA